MVCNALLFVTNKSANLVCTYGGNEGIRREVGEKEVGKKPLSSHVVRIFVHTYVHTCTYIHTRVDDGEEGTRPYFCSSRRIGKVEGSTARGGGKEPRKEPRKEGRK